MRLVSRFNDHGKFKNTEFKKSPLAGSAIDTLYLEALLWRE